MISECERGTKVSNVKKSNTKLYAYHFAAFFKSSQPWSLNLSVSEVQKWAMPKSDQIQLKTSCISFRSIFQISPWFYNFSVSEVQKRAMQKKWSNSTRDFMRREPYLVTRRILQRDVFGCNLKWPARHIRSQPQTRHEPYLAKRHIAAGHIRLYPQTARKPYSVTILDKLWAKRHITVGHIAVGHIAAGHIRL